MPKIKIGFDKVSTPFILTDQPLYDIIRGVPLRDASRNVIVTDSIVPLPSGVDSNNSTSVIVDSSPYAKPVKIIEQFPETSAVSSSLLGIPRAETQLSLFSDVSTYGLDEDLFEYYDYSSNGRPSQWYTRRNETHGNHFSPRLSEEINQQALVIEAYPVNYTFTRGPRFENYNENAYERYKNFILLGNFLYREYKDVNLSFANKQFLDPAVVTVFNNEVIYESDDSTSFDLIEKWTHGWMDMRDGTLIDPYNRQVLFPDGLGSDVTLPGSSSSGRYYGMLESKKTYRYQPGRISGFSFGFRCSTDEASVDNVIEWGVGNPSDQYVFQVRGASFSIVRRSTIPLPEKVLIRQGLTLDDQVLKGSTEPVNSKAIYETVIPRDMFNNDTVDGNGKSGYLIDPKKVTMYKIEFGWYGAVGAKFYAYVPSSNDGARWVLMHTLVIENSLNEPCLEDPRFKFRYTLDIRNTSNLREPQYLYKYGASCFIDGGDSGSEYPYSHSSEGNVVNSNSRSPLLGIMPKRKIFNSDGIGKENKNNIYPVSVNASTDQLTEIQIIEVDGADTFGHHYTPSLHSKESGIIRSFNISEDYKTISIIDGPEYNVEDIIKGNTAIIQTVLNHNLYSGQKVRISNVEGMEELNNQEFYIKVLDSKQISLFSDSSLNTAVSNTSYNDYITGGVILSIPIFRNIIDNDAKLISSKIHSSYINPIDERTATISRIGIRGSYRKTKNESISKETKVDGEIVNFLDAVDTSNVRFSNFDGIATSIYPLTGDVIDVNFLNRLSREANGQFTEFRIGVTDLLPDTREEINQIGVAEKTIFFRNKLGVEFRDLDDTDYLFEGFTQRGVSRDRDGIEIVEDIDGYGKKMGLDYRIGSPRGVDSGVPSSVRIKIDQRIGFEIDYSDTNPKTSQPGNYLIFREIPESILNVTLLGGELGIGGSIITAEASGVYFLSNMQSYVVSQETGAIGHFVEIDSIVSLNIDDMLWITSISIGDRGYLDINQSIKFSNRKIFSFNPKPLYLVLQFRDNCKVNNVSVTEYFSNSTRSFSPFWIVNDLVDVINSGGSQQGLPAEDYKSKNRLESIGVTTGLTQPLRPGVVKDSFYISEGKNKEISLDSIYGPDRTTLSTGLLNTKATFFTARSVENNNINLVDFNVVTKE